jgi:hypothetical protein
MLDVANVFCWRSTEQPQVSAEKSGGGGGGKQGLRKRRLSKKKAKTSYGPGSTRYPKQHSFVWRLPGFVRSSFWWHEYRDEDVHGALVQWQRGETDVLGETPVPVPLCVPQITQELGRDRT